MSPESAALLAEPTDIRDIPARDLWSERPANRLLVGLFPSAPVLPGNCLVARRATSIEVTRADRIYRMYGDGVVRGWWYPPSGAAALPVATPAPVEAYLQSRVSELSQDVSKGPGLPPPR